MSRTRLARDNRPFSIRAMTDLSRTDFPHLRADADFWSLRVVDEAAHNFAVRKNVPQPAAALRDRGAMLTA